MKKRLFLLPLLAAGMLCGCGENDAGGNTPTPPSPVQPDDPVGHTHSWSSWKSDANGHWKTCSGCSELGSQGAHTFNGNICSVCGYQKAADPDPVVGEPFSITLKTVGYDATKYTYAQEVVNFNAGGVAWQSSGPSTFGGVTQTYNPDWYAANPDGVIQLKKQGAGYFENTAALSGFTKITIEWQAAYTSEGTQYFPIVYKGTSVSPSSVATCEQTSTLTGTSLNVKDGKEGDKERHDVYKYTTTYVISATDTFFKIASNSSVAYIAKVSFSK